MSDEARLRELWSTLPPAGEHVDEASWERLACGELDGDARARVVDHVVTCAACARAYRTVMELATRARDLDASLPAPAGAVSRPPPRRVAPWSWLAGGALAAAAVVVVLFALPATQPPEVLRGQPRPTIDVTLEADPARVTWRPVAGAEAYRVVVYTDDGRVAFSATTQAPELRLPAEATAGRRLSIEALGAGHVIARSPLQPLR